MANHQKKKVLKQSYTPVWNLNTLWIYIQDNNPVPIHRGCDPVQVPSSWHMRVDDPTSTKGTVQLKITSDLKMKLRPSLRPLAGIPGSPQNLAAEAEMRNNADEISRGPTNPTQMLCIFLQVFIQRCTTLHCCTFPPVHVNTDDLFLCPSFTVQTFISFNLVAHMEYCRG